MVLSEAARGDELNLTLLSPQILFVARQQVQCLRLNNTLECHILRGCGPTVERHPFLRQQGNVNLLLLIFLKGRLHRLLLLPLWDPVLLPLAALLHYPEHPHILMARQSALLTGLHLLVEQTRLAQKAAHQKIEGSAM